jgi:hypothetical protein
MSRNIIRTKFKKDKKLALLDRDFHIWNSENSDFHPQFHSEIGFPETFFEDDKIERDS